MFSRKRLQLSHNRCIYAQIRFHTGGLYCRTSGGSLFTGLNDKLLCNGLLKHTEACGCCVKNWKGLMGMKRLYFFFYRAGSTLRPCPIKQKVTGVVYGLLWLSFNANNWQDAESKNSRTKQGFLETQGFCECREQKQKQKKQPQTVLTQTNSLSFKVQLDHLVGWNQKLPPPPSALLSWRVWNVGVREFLCSISVRAAVWESPWEEGKEVFDPLPLKKPPKLIVAKSFTETSSAENEKLSLAFLTLRDELHVFLVLRGESLFMPAVCGERQSGKMVLLPVQTVENYLGCRKADKWKEKSEILLILTVWKQTKKKKSCPLNLNSSRLDSVEVRLQQLNERGSMCCQGHTQTHSGSCLLPQSHHGNNRQRVKVCSRLRRFKLLHTHSLEHTGTGRKLLGFRKKVNEKHPSHFWQLEGSL